MARLGGIFLQRSSHPGGRCVEIKVESSVDEVEGVFVLARFL